MISFLSYSKPQAPENMWAFWPFLSLSFFSSFLSFWSCLDIFCLSRSFSEKDRFPVSQLWICTQPQMPRPLCPPLKMAENIKPFSVPWDIHWLLFFIFLKNTWLLTRLIWVVGNNYQYFRNFKSVLTNAHKEVKCKLKFQLSLGFKQCHK